MCNKPKSVQNVKTWSRHSSYGGRESRFESQLTDTGLLEPKLSSSSMIVDHTMPNCSNPAFTF
jgi:hypothetical protein